MRVVSFCIALATIAAIGSVCFAADDSIPAGIYNTRGTAEDYASLPELDKPYIAGVSYRIRWSIVEPKEGQFDWSTLDRAYKQVVDKKKWLMVTVTAGMFSPDWIYEKGVKTVNFSPKETQWMKTDQDKVRMPVTWDETYLKAWENCLKALGEKLKTMDRVYCVHLTGGGFICEMHLPKTLPETNQQWKDAGINDEILINMWKRIITDYDKYMPKHVGLSLAFGIPFPGSKCFEGLYPWANEKFPGRLWWQKNSLQEKAFDNNEFADYFKEFSKTTTVGWQMMIARDKDAGDRKKSYQHALNTGAEFVEAYPQDVNNPELAEGLTFLNDGLKDIYRKKHPKEGQPEPKPQQKQ